MDTIAALEATTPTGLFAVLAFAAIAAILTGFYFGFVRGDLLPMMLCYLFLVVPTVGFLLATEHQNDQMADILTVYLRDERDLTVTGQLTIKGSQHATVTVVDADGDAHVADITWVSVSDVAQDGRQPDDNYPVTVRLHD